MIGKLKFYNGIKGYGFITVDDGRDIFFHHSLLLMTEAEKRHLKNRRGVEMVFDEKTGPRWVYGADVRLKGGA